MDYDIREVQKAELEILKQFDCVCKKLKLKYFLSSGTLLGAVRHKGFIPWDDDVDVMMPWKDYKKFLKYGQKELGSKYFLQSNFSDLWYREYSKIRMNGTTAIEECYKDIPFHQGVWIDIFPIVGVRNDPKWIGKFNKYIKFRNLFVQDLFFERTENLSEGIKIFRKIPLGLRRKAIKFMDLFFIKQPYKYDKATEIWGFGILKKEIHSAEIFFGSSHMEFENCEFDVMESYDEYLIDMYGDYMTPPDEEHRNSGHKLLIVDLNKNYTDYLK